MFILIVKRIFNNYIYQLLDKLEIKILQIIGDLCIKF